MMTTEAMIRSYEIGTTYRGRKLSAAWDTEIYRWRTTGEYRIPAESPILIACFEAGVLGHDMPSWVTGWRYGDLPEGGYSRNHRDDHWERGISIMALDTDTEPQTDGTFAMFNGHRDRVRIGGWLIGFRGSDGERLVVGAVRL